MKKTMLGACALLMTLALPACEVARGTGEIATGVGRTAVGAGRIVGAGVRAVVPGESD